MDAPDLAQIAALEMRANGFEPMFAPEVRPGVSQVALAACIGELRESIVATPDRLLALPHAAGLHTPRLVNAA